MRYCVAYNKKTLEPVEEVPMSFVTNYSNVLSLLL